MTYNNLMPQPHPTPAPRSKPASGFQTTRWSLVQAAGHLLRIARTALEAVLRDYWSPLFAHLYLTASVGKTQDLTQEFFARILEKNSLLVADRNRGKFRSFLLASLKNFLANEYRAETTQKRGGGRKPVSLDFPSAETQYSFTPTDSLTAERIFERQWALVILERALQKLSAEQSAAGKASQFKELKAYLTSQDAGASYHEIAEKLAMTPGAIKGAVHRLRRRYRELLREEIAHTVTHVGEIDDELRALFRALGP